MARETAEHVGHVTNTTHIAVSCPYGGHKDLYAVGEEGSEVSAQAADTEEELQAWCLLEESEHEQWQDVNSGKVYKHERKPRMSHCWVLKTIQARLPRTSLKV